MHLPNSTSHRGIFTVHPVHLSPVAAETAPPAAIVVLAVTKELFLQLKWKIAEPPSGMKRILLILSDSSSPSPLPPG